MKIARKKSPKRASGLPLTKLSGAGNTFLLIDWRNDVARVGFRKKFGSASRSRAAAELCDPYRSVGADGLLFLESPAKSEQARGAQLKWDFYNADGSRAEMCGNAARVVGLYENNLPLALLTRAGVVNISGDGAKAFKVEMPLVENFEPNQLVKIGSTRFEFDFVDTGVPHAVVHLARARGIKQLLQNVDNLVEIVGSIRSLTKFKKTGVNVTFYVTKDARPPRLSRSANIDSLTYERGVPGFTQACGTGVVAAAYSFSHKRVAATKKVTVRVPGGVLNVELSGARPILVGPAVEIAQMNMS